MEYGIKKVFNVINRSILLTVLIGLAGLSNSFLEAFGGPPPSYAEATAGGVGASVVAAGLRPIIYGNYSVAGYNEGGWATYWLHTGPGENDVALIALNHPGREDSPAIDPVTLEANFHYITDYFNERTGSYVWLPAGLYMWHNGGPKVRPFEKIKYGWDNAQKCFVQTKPVGELGLKVRLLTDRPFDATKNPFALGRGSQRRDVTQKYEESGHRIPLHPFDVPGWAERLVNERM